MRTAFSGLFLFGLLLAVQAVRIKDAALVAAGSNTVPAEVLDAVRQDIDFEGFTECLEAEDECLDELLSICGETGPACCSASNAFYECKMEKCPEFSEYFSILDCEDLYEYEENGYGEPDDGDDGDDDGEGENSYEETDYLLKCYEATEECHAEFERNCTDNASECCDAYTEYYKCLENECPEVFEDFYEDYIKDNVLGCDYFSPGGTPGLNQCFSASSRVHLEDGSVKSMEELAIGDRVQTGQGTFSEVFSWGHRDPEANASFRRIHAGDRHIEVTGSHYLLVNGKLVAAESIKTGDLLTLGEGGQAEVTGIETVNLKGLYNPHTLDGQIVVNGLTASIYTRAVPPHLAHYLLAVPRLLYRLGLGDVLGSYLHGATPIIGRMIPRGSTVYN